VFKLQGKLSAARSLLERALAINEAAHGPQHREVGTTLILLGGVAREQGDLTAACRFFERALSITEASLSANHPEVAVSFS
jgi:hypothetical protein